MNNNLEEKVDEEPKIMTLGKDEFVMGIDSSKAEIGDVIETTKGLEIINEKRFDHNYDILYDTPHGEFHYCEIKNYGKKVN